MHVYYRYVFHCHNVPDNKTVKLHSYSYFSHLSSFFFRLPSWPTQWKRITLTAISSCIVNSRYYFLAFAFQCRTLLDGFPGKTQQRYPYLRCFYVILWWPGVCWGWGFWCVDISNISHALFNYLLTAECLIGQEIGVVALAVKYDIIIKTISFFTICHLITTMTQWQEDMIFGIWCLNIPALYICRAEKVRH